MARVWQAITRGIDGVCVALAWVAAALALAMMCLTVADVVGRYFLRSPIRGAFELTEILMGLMVFFALPLMVRRGGNIRVTILFERFPPAAQRWASVATELLGAAICGLIAWRMWLFGSRIQRFGEVTMELRIPRGLVAQCMSLLLVAGAIAFVLCAVEALRREGAAPARAPGAQG